MLVFNEGVPRAGKSYDAVRTHILESLKNGRQVYARLNGLDHAKIAAYLGQDVDQVRAHLHLVESGKVKETFRAEQRDDGQWFIPDHLKDALFVIDECHEFYVSTREAMEPAVEQFFALHGQNGMDGVLLSQWYKRLHVAVRARVERKNVFQKLTAAGMKGHYRVNFYQTIAPDKFETTGGETRKYDKAIFPLYAGYADGASNDGVYEGGGRTIFQALKFRALLIVPIGLVAVYYLVSFFTGGVSLTKDAKADQVATSPATPNSPAPAVPGVALPATTTPPAPKFNPLQAYVYDLGKRGRVRLAARIESEGGQVGLVEWVDTSGNVYERLTTNQLRQLGWDVYFQGFGLELNSMGERIVVTAWPLNVPQREESPTLYRLDSNSNQAPRLPSVSEPGAGASSSSPRIGTDYVFPNP